MTTIKMGTITHRMAESAASIISVTQMPPRSIIGTRTHRVCRVCTQDCTL